MSNWIIGLAWIVCRLQDMWIDITKYFHDLYIRVRVKQISNRLKYHIRPSYTLVCAYLDPIKYRLSGETSPQCIPIDLTTIIEEYYRIDKIQSCFSLQKWLARFHVQCKFINVIYRSRSDIFLARIDLDNDIETHNGYECSDLSFNVLPGVIVHSYDRQYVK